MLSEEQHYNHVSAIRNEGCLLAGIKMKRKVF
jgi:hypothetical protein